MPLYVMALPPAMLMIKGVITDKATGKPVAGATISIVNTHIHTLSDQKGYYQLEDLPAADLQLMVNLENYRQQVVKLKKDRPVTTVLNIALEEREVTLNEVTVAARLNRRSDLAARVTERNTIQLTDIVSGNFIEQSASLSAADVIQYIPGLTVTRTHEGNSDKAVIRGMEPKYGYTTLNGLKIPSTDDRSRYISLDFFPAELLQSVEAYKSLTADMEGDAIGGAINLVTREAPEKMMLTANLSTGYNTRFFGNDYTTFNSHAVDKQSPFERFGPSYYASGADFTKDNLSFTHDRPLPDLSGNLLFGKSMFKDKVGLIVAAGYKNIKTGSSGYFMPPATEPQLNNVPAFADFNKRDYNNNKINDALYSQLSVKPAAGHLISLQYLFLYQKDIETRTTVDTSLVQGRSIAGTGRISLGNRSRMHTQQLNNLVLKGQHNLQAFTIGWAGTYSVAKGSYPDWAELTANTGRLLGPAGNIEQTPLLLAPLNRIWLNNTEHNKDAYLDLTYKPALFKQKVTFGGGGLVSYKTRDNFYNSYNFIPSITQNNGQPFTDIYNAQWLNNNGPQNPLGTVNNANTYSASERIDAWYLQAILQMGPSVITAGIRMEQTTQHLISSQDAALSYGKTVDINYKDFLPDLHWKYNLNDKQLVRADYFKGITRPALSDITFAAITYEDYQVAGNPFLVRTSGDNFDLRYEWYRSGSNQIKGGVFYKHLNNVYEKTLLNGNDELYPIPQEDLDYTPAGVLTEQLRNTGTGTNYGAEISFNQYWGKLGLSGNYTLTFSNIARLKKVKLRDDPADASSNIITVTRMEKGPLQGQAKHTGSVSISYKQLPGNWTANFSVIYTGQHIDLVSPWYGLDSWQRQTLMANFYAEKSLGPKFKISLGASNIFHSGVTDDILQPNPSQISNSLPGQTSNSRITVLKENYAAYYTIGLKYIAF